MNYAGSRSFKLAQATMTTSVVTPVVAHRLALLVRRCATRVTSDGETVISKHRLGEIPSLIGKRRCSLKTIQDRLAVLNLELRQGEFKLPNAVIVTAFLCGAELDAVGEAMIRTATTETRELLQRHTTTTMMGDDTPTAKTPIDNVEVCDNKTNNNDLSDNRDGSSRVLVGNNTTYDTKTNGELIQTLVARDAALERLKQSYSTHKKEIRNITRQLDRCRTKIQKLEQLVAQRTDADSNEPSQLLKFTFAKPHGKRLALAGVLATGIRRNFSHVACSDVGAICLQDNLTRFKVARSEVQTHALLQLSSFDFYSAMQADLRQTFEDQFVLSSTVFAADATASIWKKKKVSSCFVDTCYYIGPDALLLPMDELPSQRRLADSQEVLGGKTEDSVALLLKHLSSLGCPSWQRGPSDRTGKDHVNLFMYCSDDGSDQAGIGKTVPYQIDDDLTIWMRTLCYDHQGHLIEKDGLKVLDTRLKAIDRTWKFYSSVVKVCHLWRANHKAVATAINERHPEDSVARKLSRTICPKCDIGRWGAVHVVEIKLKTIGVGNLLSAFVNSFKGIEESRKTPTAKELSDAVNEISLEEMSAWVEKQTRWKKDVLRTMPDPFFNVLIEIDVRNSRPVEHLRNWMRQIRSSE